KTCPSKRLGFAGFTSSSFGKNNAGTIVFLQVFRKFQHLSNSLPRIFPIYKNRASVAKIIRNRRNAFAKFFLGNKLWMILPQIPDDRRNIPLTLMIGNYNDRCLFGQRGIILIFNDGPQKVQATQQTPV